MVVVVVQLRILTCMLLIFSTNTNVFHHFRHVCSEEFHHCCHGMLVFPSFRNYHRKQVRRASGAKKFAPQNFSCLPRCWPTSDDFVWINMLVKSDDPLALMTKLEKVFVEVDKVHTFEARFFKDRIEHAYRDFQMQFKVFSFLAFLAISIASMGLLGMAVFTAETRMKEISVRKVLGASNNNLFYLLSKGFLRMFIVASLIAMPFSYLFFEQVVLIDFANRISVNLLDLMSGVIVILIIGLSTIAWQTRSATQANPAEVLRNE